MALALFDLDHTLLDGCSTYTWNVFVGEEILAGDREHLAMADALHNNDKGGKSVYTIDDYYQFILKIYPQYSVEDLHLLTARFITQRIEPIIHLRAREIVAEHRRQGDLAVMITATNQVIAEPISRLFDMDGLICTLPELVEGRYTGKVSGAPCYRQEKLTYLDSWLAARALTLEGAHFYSDSHNDLPLLLKVDHPVAVDPDPVLLEHARSKGWQVMRFKDRQ